MVVETTHGEDFFNYFTRLSDETVENMRRIPLVPNQALVLFVDETVPGGLITHTEFVPNIARAMTDEEVVYMRAFEAQAVRDIGSVCDQRSREFDLNSTFAVLLRAILANCTDPWKRGQHVRCLFNWYMLLVPKYFPRWGALVMVVVHGEAYAYGYRPVVSVKSLPIPPHKH